MVEFLDAMKGETLKSEAPKSTLGEIKAQSNANKTKTDSIRKDKAVAVTTLQLLKSTTTTSPSSPVKKSNSVSLLRHELTLPTTGTSRERDTTVSSVNQHTVSEKCTTITQSVMTEYPDTTITVTTPSTTTVVVTADVVAATATTTTPTTTLTATTTTTTATQPDSTTIRSEDATVLDTSYSISASSSPFLSRDNTINTTRTQVIPSTTLTSSSTTAHVARKESSKEPSKEPSTPDIRLTPDTRPPVAKRGSGKTHPTTPARGARYYDVTTMTSLL